ncbi:MAG: HNH endonuclease, partial [Oligoflexia bacterium]|nr:HNH endonuclease [Oligoflexia bacterium]
MASGRARCMYCEDSLGTDIDHFRPKADFPQRAFAWPNYLLACSHCNSNLKRNAFPIDGNGDPLLLDPSADNPAEHLLFSPSTGEFVSVGAKGQESIRVFGLNDDT